MPPLRIEPGSPASQGGTYATTPRTLTQLEKLILLLISFPAIGMNMLVFFLGKCIRTAAKTIVMDKKTRRH